mgnify:CR=1 FL=1
MFSRSSVSTVHLASALSRCLIVLAVGLFLGQPLAAQPSGAARKAERAASSASPAGTAEGTSLENLTAAEQIAGVQRLLAVDQQRLATLQEQLQQLEGEFEQAAEEFTQLDTRLTEVRAHSQTAVDAEEQVRRQATLAALEKEWSLARDGFDRIIERRKAVQEQLNIVTEKIELEQRALKRLKQTQPETEAAPEGEAEAPPANAPAVVPEPATQRDATRDPLSIRNWLPGLTPVTIPEPATDESETPPVATTEAVAEPAVVLSEVDEQVLDARRELKDKQAALDAARREVEEVDNAIAVFERDLQSAERLLASAREEVQATTALVRSATAEIERLTAEGAAEAELASPRTDLAEKQNRLRLAREDAATQLTRVRESSTLLQQLAVARREAVRKAAEAADEVSSAESRLLLLESPVAPHRLVRWVTRTGPRVLLVLAAIAFLWWLVRALANRSVGALVRRSRRGTAAERDQRAETLRRVFGYAAGLAAFSLGLLAVLHTSGIDVTVLLGGTAVIGAAVAFGSQNLVQDYFSGFMILAENQYSVGNVIRIADTTGVVEDITLRMTVLRDEEGTVHFIPHGQVTKVSNLTHGWSRAVFKIKVAYDEDVDRVMEVLMDLAREMRDDEQFGPQMLGQPEMQGVEAFDESAIIVKFLVKTRPLMQWSVRRELLRRIKNRFDQLGIETPLPQRVIHEPKPRNNGSKRSSTWTPLAGRR